MSTPIKKAAGGFKTTTATTSHNATDFIASGVRQTSATASFCLKPYSGIGRRQYRAVRRCDRIRPGAERHHGIGVPMTSCDVSRSHRIWSAAFEFVPPVFGGSNGRAQALPVSARMSRYANLFESPPSIGVESVGFYKSTSLEAIMAKSACAFAHSLPTTGTPDPIQLHAEAHNALAMAVHYLTQPRVNVPGAARKAVQALAALRRLDVSTVAERAA